MKFLYEYRTSDNAHHSGVIVAPDREAAFSRLKADGIRPWKMVEAPGILNWIIGKGKRWIAIVVLAATAIFFAVAPDRPKDDDIFTSAMRRQIIGDTAVIEKGQGNGWADFFSDEGEQFLASFAVPGVPAGKRVSTEGAIRLALERKIVPDATDGIEARQIKSIVEGMKVELRRFLSDDGTIQEYCERLVRRQEEEIGYYNRAKTELETAKGAVSARELQGLWEARNDELRKMGIRLVPLP